MLARHSESDEGVISDLFYLELNESMDSPIDEEWGHEMRMGMRKKLCARGCSRVRRRWYGLEVSPVFSRESSLAIINMPAVIVLRRDLAGIIRQHLTKHAIWSKCRIGKDRVEYYDYLALYVPIEHGVFLRGGYESKYEICETCGCPRLLPDGTESQVEYISRYQLAAENAYMLEGNSGVLVTRLLADQIDWGKRYEIDLYPYPVMDEPLDHTVFYVDELRDRDRSK